VNCKHGNPEGRCPTCAEHAIFKAAAERRKANGVKLGFFRIRVDENAIVSMNNFWDGWCETLGKEKATDYLLVAMREADERLRAALERRGKRGQGRNDHRAGESL